MQRRFTQRLCGSLLRIPAAAFTQQPLYAQSRVVSNQKGSPDARPASFTTPPQSVKAASGTATGSSLPQVKRTVGSSSSSGSAAAEEALRRVYTGVVRITSQNVNTEMDTKVPLFLYFTATTQPDWVAYTERLCQQVDQANRRLQTANMGDVYQEFGPDHGLAIKLGIVDCLTEPALSRRFNVNQYEFPIVLFVRRRLFCDKLVGTVPESHVKEVVDAFIEYGKEQSQSEKDGTSFVDRIRRSDQDDENGVTLISAAQKKMKENDLSKAKELFEKALRLSVEEAAALEAKYGVAKRKMTPELRARLKKESCYNVAPEALSGIAMCHMARGEKTEAVAVTKRIREEYPSALVDLRDVAEAVVRIELIELTGFDVNTDNYASLLKYEELTTDPLEFYTKHLKLVVCMHAEQAHKKAIEECLKLIRAEPKLLPVLKAGGLVPEDLVLGPRASTPARQVLLKLFEALGSTNKDVVEGRRLMQLYI